MLVQASLLARDARHIAHARTQAHRTRIAALMPAFFSACALHARSSSGLTRSTLPSDRAMRTVFSSSEYMSDGSARVSVGQSDADFDLVYRKGFKITPEQQRQLAEDETERNPPDRLFYVVEVYIADPDKERWAAQQAAAGRLEPRTRVLLLDRREHDVVPGHARLVRSCEVHAALRRAFSWAGAQCLRQYSLDSLNDEHHNCSKCEGTVRL